MKTIWNVVVAIVLAWFSFDYIRVRSENSELQVTLQRAYSLDELQARVLRKFNYSLNSCRTTLDERVRISQEMALARAEAIERFNRRRMTRVAWNND